MDHPLRDADLEIHLVDDGYVVYQGSANRVHYLNVTAALVLELCDGARTPADIAAEVASTLELAEPPVDAVDDCLRQLRAEHLVA